STRLTTRTPAATAGPLAGSSIDPRRVLAHAVVPLSRRDRAGEIARTSGARPQRGSAHRGRRAAPAGPGGGAEPAMAGRSGAAPAAVGSPVDGTGVPQPALCRLKPDSFFRKRPATG